MHHLALVPATPTATGNPAHSAGTPRQPRTRLDDEPALARRVSEPVVPGPDDHPSRRARIRGKDRLTAIAVTPPDRSHEDGGPRGGALVEFPTSADPSPATLCSNLARSVVEILAGARPLDQIGRWVSDSVYVHLLRRTMLTVKARSTAAENPLRPRMTIGEPLLAFPIEGVVEAVVMVHQPGRSRAVAIRLERHRTRWRATAINVL